MARDTTIALLLYLSEHTKSLYMLGMILGSSVESSWVATLARLGIRVELMALPVDEEFMVSR